MPKADHSDWRDGFLFLGNQLALDFLNTRPVLEGQPTELLTDFAALLRWFAAANLLTPAQASNLKARWDHTPQTEKTVATMRKFREQLREEILNWENGTAIQRSTLDTLNHLMAEHPMHTRLTGKGTSCVSERWFNARQPDDLLAPLADSAAELFATLDRQRVRQCDNCVLHFLDTSKKGTRRWCSMQLCGNRLKVAAYAARQRRRR